MKKIGIFIIGALVISLGMFSGCTDVQDQISDALSKMKIDSFDATPGSITTLAFITSLALCVTSKSYPNLLIAFVTLPILPAP